MEQKNRRVIVVAIILLIAIAMFASFGRSLFALNTPEVILPSSSSGTENPSGSLSGSGRYHRVNVTPQTVGSVVATLVRPESYYRELTIETFWEGGSSSARVQVWRDDGWAHSRQTLPSGVIRHDLTGDDTLYYWYEGSSKYQTAPADEFTSDLSQHIPTYETVVELEKDWITDAGYVTKGDLPCVYAQVQLPDSSIIQRYWVSVDSGLLIAAESEEDGQLIYRMTAYSPAQSPCPSDGEFELPDGTVLHTLDEP